MQGVPENLSVVSKGMWQYRGGVNTHCSDYLVTFVRLLSWIVETGTSQNLVLCDSRQGEEEAQIRHISPEGETGNALDSKQQSCLWRIWSRCTCDHLFGAAWDCFA